MNLNNIDWKALALKARDVMKAHGPVIAIVTGCVLAMTFGGLFGYPGYVASGFLAFFLWVLMSTLDFPDFGAAHWVPFGRGMLATLDIFGILLCLFILLTLIVMGRAL